jgi:hypothetical protein
MRYIKLFEEVGGYYNEITRYEFYGAINYNINDFVEENWIPFTESEIKKIMEYFPSSQRKEYKWEYEKDFTAFAVGKKASIDIKMVDIKMVDIESYTDVRIPPKKSKERSIFNITKLVDDWFFVHHVVTGRYYKCDQFDGLLEFLY